MKRLSFLLALVAMLVGVLLALGVRVALSGGADYIYRYTVENLTPTYWQDTTWFPASTQFPLEMANYKHFEVRFSLLDPDTLVADTFHLALYTGHYRNVDSARLWYALPNDTPLAGDDSATVTWRYLWPDSTAPDRYVWLRALHNRGFVAGYFIDADTILAEQDVWTNVKGDSVLDWNTTSQNSETKTVAANGDLWGDSLSDWNTSSGTRESCLDEGIGALDTTDYIYVVGSDSLCANALEDHTTGLFTDSLIFTIVAGRESTTVAACTLGIALGIGDSSTHSYGLVTVGTQQNFPLSATLDTLTVIFRVDPYGEPIDSMELDSLFVVFNAVHVDTTVNGDAGELRVHLLDVDYKTEGTFYTEIDDAAGSLDYTDYVYPIASDSVIMFHLSSPDTGWAGAWHWDSVAVRVVVAVESTMVEACTLKYGLALQPDTSAHYYGGPGATPTVDDLVTVALRDNDTLTLWHKFATSPSGTYFDSTVVDSLMFVLDCPHLDTTAYGNSVMLKVFAVLVIPYHMGLSPGVRLETYMLFKE